MSISGRSARLRERVYRLAIDPLRYLGPIGWLRYLADKDRRQGARIHPLDWKEAQAEV